MHYIAIDENVVEDPEETISRLKEEIEKLRKDKYLLELQLKKKMALLKKEEAFLKAIMPKSPCFEGEE